MTRVIVDSDILIYVSRNDSAAIRFVSDLENTSIVAMSSITAMELIVGCGNKLELSRLQKFLQRFQLLQVTEEISVRSIELVETYNLSHGLLIADGLIAATALTLGEPLATNNQRDFRFISGLNLLAYP